jgi:hypothetical protein
MQITINRKYNFQTFIDVHTYFLKLNRSFLVPLYYTVDLSLIIIYADTVSD